MSRDCEHGSLRRSCEICDRDQEIARLRQANEMNTSNEMNTANETSEQTNVQPGRDSVHETVWLSWISATSKPTGWERPVLVWVVWPECGWPQLAEPKIGWWKHGPECFAVDDVENANHLVTHWMDIPVPNQ